MTWSLNILLLAIFAFGFTFQQDIRVVQTLLDIIASTGRDTVINTIRVDSAAARRAIDSSRPAYDAKRSFCQQICFTCTGRHCESRARQCNRSGQPVTLDNIVLNALVNSPISGLINQDFTQLFPSHFSNILNGGLLGHVGRLLPAAVTNPFRGFGSIFGGFRNHNFLGNILGGIRNPVNTAGNAVNTAGNAVENVATNVGNAVSNAAESIGKSIGSIFGRKRRSVRETPPTCSQLRSNTTECIYYTSECPCDFSAQCAGYTQVATPYRNALESARWLAEIANSTTSGYRITEMTYRWIPPYFDSTTGKFRFTRVKVSFFGRDVEFVMNEPVDIFDTVVSGPIVANKAIESFKIQVAADASNN